MSSVNKMSSVDLSTDFFHMINYNDIVDYLQYYGFSLPDNKRDAYDLALKLLLSEQTNIAPYSISEFYMKYKQNQTPRTLFDTLPNELINIIAQPMNCRDLSKLCDTMPSISNYCRNNMGIIKSKLSHLRLNLDLYDDESIFNICRYRHYKAISSYEDDILAIIGGAVYTNHPNGKGLLRVKLPTNETPKLVSMKFRMFYILTESGNVYSGYSSPPKLIEIREKIKDISSQNNVPYVLFLSETGNLYADGYLDFARNIMSRTKIEQGPISEYANIVKVVALRYFIWALDIQGNVYGWGTYVRNNRKEQYNKPTKIEKFSNIKNIYGWSSLGSGLVVLIDNNNKMTIVGNFYMEISKNTKLFDVFLTEQLEPYTALTLVDTCIIYVNTQNEFIVLSVDPRWGRLSNIYKYQISEQLIDMSATLSDTRSSSDIEIVVDMIVSVNGQEQLKQSRFENPRFTHFAE